MNLFSLLLGIFCLVPTLLFAQKADTALSEKKGFAYAVNLYRNATHASQHLYNGREYYVYDEREEQHQFFESDAMEQGSVHYDGQLYPSVLLMYDLVKDEVSIEHEDGYDQIQLQSEKVAYFTLLDHRFVRLENRVTGLRTGFYDVLFEKRLKVIARRIKERDPHIEGMKVVIDFFPVNHFYIYKDSIYHRVGSKKSVLGLFSDQKSALRKYIRDNKLRFKNNRETAIVKLTAYYDQLTTL